MTQTLLKPSAGKRRLRYKRDPDVVRGRVLTDLDLAVIETINEFQILATSWLIALVSADSRTVYDHLQALWHEGWIARFTFPQRGSSEAYYYLDNPKVVDLVAAFDRSTQAFNRERIRRRREREYSAINDPDQSEELAGRVLFLKHEVMISRFHVCLVLTCKKSQGRVALIDWRQGPELWSSVEAPRLRWDSEKKTWKETDTNERLTVRPDSFAGLRFFDNPPGDRDHYFVIEHDRGRESGPVFAKKLRGHHQFILHQKKLHHIERHYGVPRIRAVLTETIDSRWAAHLRKLAKGKLVSSSPSPLFWFTTSPFLTFGPDYIETEKAIARGEIERPPAYFLTHPEIILSPIWAPPTDDVLYALHH